MISDEERREVAQNMRDVVKSKSEYELLSLNGSSAAIRWLISYVVFGDKKYHSGVDLMNRLADLIEPSCDAAATHTDATATRDVSQCRRSDVDRDALMALAGDLETYRLPISGIAVAEHIREACGEVVA